MSVLLSLHKSPRKWRKKTVFFGCCACSVMSLLLLLCVIKYTYIHTYYSSSAFFSLLLNKRHAIKNGPIFIGIDELERRRSRAEQQKTKESFKFYCLLFYFLLTTAKMLTEAGEGWWRWWAYKNTIFHFKKENKVKRKKGGGWHLTWFAWNPVSINF